MSVDSDPPEEEEITGVSHRALRGDVVALKIKHIELAHKELKGEHKETRKTVEAMDKKLDGISMTVKVIAALVPIVGLLLGGIYWLSHTQPSTPPSAQDIAREVVKQQQK